MPNTSKNIDISVILTFHNEGAVAHKTFLAVDRCLKKLDEANVSYEIIAHIDNGDEATFACVEKAAQTRDIRVFKNKFGDPSNSRNFAISQARGKYLCVQDGDDLYSENWLIDAYKIQEASKEPLILHTEFNLTFGLNEQPRLWQMFDSKSFEEDMLILFGRNRWSVGIFARTEDMKKYPYEDASGCYGYEDWLFNCVSRFAGIKHNVVPNSIHFYRVRSDSTYARHTSMNVALGYADAFSIENMKKLYRPEFEQNPGNVVDNNKMLYALRIGHKVLRHTPVLRRFDDDITEKIAERRAKKRMQALPKPFLDEWRAMNRVDGTLYPDPEVIARMPIYKADLDYLGKAYCCMMNQLERNPDYVFMMPEMGVGGTEKVLENYLRAIAEIHPDWHVAVFGKLPENHPYKIPKNVSFIDFTNITKNLVAWDREFLLTRFLVQTKAKRIHIVNDEMYYRWAINNKRLLLHEKIVVNCSFFMYEFKEDENRCQSFADPLLMELIPCVNKIFTDNASVVEKLVRLEGFDREKFSVHYQPVNFKVQQLPAPKTRKVLWASRIAQQKRPDILKKVAEKLPSDMHIDVYGRFQKEFYDKSFFNGCKNLTYCGEFSNIRDLPIKDYDVFFYTSQTDGIPNILLEITALGLPIVATNEGGVPDFIEDGKSGRLVEMNDYDAYVAALQDTLDESKREAYVKAAQEKLSSRHSWEKFVAAVKKDF